MLTNTAQDGDLGAQSRVICEQALDRLDGHETACALASCRADYGIVASARMISDMSLLPPTKYRQVNRTGLTLEAGCRKTSRAAGLKSLAVADAHYLVRLAYLDGCGTSNGALEKA